MQNKSTFKRALLCAAALTLAPEFWVGSAVADTPPSTDAEVAPQTYVIAPQSLAGALRQFGAQAGVPVLFSESLVSGLKSNGLNGQYAPEAGLEILLAGTGLEAASAPGGAWVVRKSSEDRATDGPATSGNTSSEAPKRLASDPAEDSKSEDVLLADKVTVTGTSLRGLAPESSPLQVYGREEVLGSGATSVSQFLRALPQSFGGGSSEFTALGLPNDSNSRQNNTSGSSANLRGLGSRGTLVLINGNRMAPTSQIGDFVDLSLIPMSAIERVEVLTDGASSIYGGDAVAGVINFILRDDFDGAETSASYGTVTEGRMEEYRFSQTLGTDWESGNLLGTYEYTSRDNLTLGDRPDIGLFEPQYADQVLPERRLFDLLPSQVRHSALLSGHQQVGPRLNLSASGLYSLRNTEKTRFGANGSIDSYDIESEGLTVALGMDYELSETWVAALNATFAQVENAEQRFRIVNGFPGDDPVDDVRTNSDLWSVDLKFDGDLIVLPGGTAKVAVGGHLRRETFSNELLGQQVTSDGERDVSALYAEVQIPIIDEDNAFPGMRRLEMNLSGRMDDYSDFGTSSNPKIGLLWSPAEGINVRGSYSTSFAPPPLGRAFSLNRLGQLIPYDFVLSFIGGEAPDPSLAGTGYLQVFGTAKDLEPETSETYTAGFDADWAYAGSDFTISATYYDISFEGRLGATPIPFGQTDYAAPNIAWNDPDALPAGSVVFFPTEQEIEALLASLDSPIMLFMDASLDNVGIINNVNIVRNLARTDTSGLDLQFDFATDTPAGEFNAGFNANYILDFVQQASSRTPAVETLNTYLNPVDLQLRGHASLSRGGLTARAFVNYVDAYQVDLTEGAASIPSWTTADISLSYDFAQPSSSWLRGVGLSLSVNNLFDKGPPSAPANQTYSVSAFDPTNASPLGRFITFEVRKAF